jgi:hypothetical protein
MEDPLLKGNQMSIFIDRLKLQMEENPLAALAVGSVVASAITKLMKANTERINSQTWSREVDRRNRRN